MTIEHQNETEASLAACRPGHSLPAHFYTSRHMYEIDLEVFFHRQWTLVGFVSEVPEPGDVRRVDIGKTSLLLVRDDEEDVRVFHNVCRHRGARLVSEDSTSVGRLTCGYHQWSYDLSGDLIYAAHMGSSFDKCSLGLKQVQHRVVGGMVFVCIAEDAPADFDEVAAELESRLAPFQLDKAKVAFQKTIFEEGNWKLSVDNNRECYHCEGSHPELTQTLVGMDIGFDPEEVPREELDEYALHVAESELKINAWERQGFICHPAERYGDHETMLRTQRFVIAGAGESHTMTGRAAVNKLLGAVTDPVLGDCHIHTYNSWHHVFADHAVMTYIIPVAPDRTAVHTVWLVNADAREGVDYDLDTLTEVWIATNQQDADLVAMAQQGVESTGYEPGPLSPFTERTVALNSQWYLERLRASGYVR